MLNESKKKLFETELCFPTSSGDFARIACTDALNVHLSVVVF